MRGWSFLKERVAGEYAPVFQTFLHLSKLGMAILKPKQTKCILASAAEIYYPSLKDDLKYFYITDFKLIWTKRLDEPSICKVDKLARAGAVFSNKILFYSWRSSCKPLSLTKP